MYPNLRKYQHAGDAAISAFHSLSRPPLEPNKEELDALSLAAHARAEDLAVFLMFYDESTLALTTLDIGCMNFHLDNLHDFPKVAAEVRSREDAKMSQLQIMEANQVSARDMASGRDITCAECTLKWVLNQK